MVAGSRYCPRPEQLNDPVFDVGEVAMGGVCDELFEDAVDGAHLPVQFGLVLLLHVGFEVVHFLRQRVDPLLQDRLGRAQAVD